MRIHPIICGELYHVIGRGNNRQTIFKDERDYIRFLFLILYFQSSRTFSQVGRSVSYYVKHQVFDIKADIVKDIVKNREVELVEFTFTSNHFHLILREIKEGGISRYMQRVLNAYAKYFNTKYEQSGHLFQGPFKAIHIEDDNQLFYLSAYIHSNIKELKGWKGKEVKYPWSSYQDFVKKNRWGKLLKNDIIMSNFKDGKEYKEFVEESGAKESLEEDVE
jgi:putative transposase